ncbi:helix-turn-helix transcriptional regulator [Mycolicibacterium sp. lyk4-40-TYG-92]|uniref:helix-turn-helix domain-containing protein n=1 Tax=Mycolicibacterium sp. lyk4-40-TYG-92 TaxID=3040295 RepID=UPI00254EB072|nr:helix-turn-helix transcriptional regulator [Mycolicibacterium sp. lyk4-40-TYG-92]
MSDSDSDVDGWRKRIGKALEDARKRSGLSAVQLSARTRELQVPVHRVAITKLESGERDITVAELLVLAMALNTAPVGLLCPGPYGKNVALLPGVETSQFVAAQWISGLYDHAPPAPGANFYDYRKNLAALRTARLVDELDARKKLLLEIIARLDGSAESKVAATVLTDQLTMIETDIQRYQQDSDDG